MMVDTYEVQRSATVDAPPERVFAQLADFRAWRTWSPWEDIDPDIRRSYLGPATGRGAGYAWSGNRKAGRGRMRIVEATEPSKVAIDLEFDKPFKARNDLVFAVEPVGADGPGAADGGRSRVTWTMSGRQTLMTRVMGVFKSMDAVVGPDFERGLARLKATVEGRSGTTA
jgi:uncharacterized protein YndB with AHSA1/START domain